MHNPLTKLVSFKYLTLVVAGMAVSLSAAQAQTVIYSDTFTRTSALNGSTPDVDLTTATWVADPSSVTDGSVANSPNQTNSFLAFTPTAGSVYTFSLDLTANNANPAQWAAFGFSASNNTSGAFHTANVDSPWMLMTGNGSIQTFGGSTTGSTDNGQSSDVTGTGVNGSLYTITLNTTAAAWTYSFAGAGITTTTYTFAANPTINDIGFGSSAGGATIDNLTLTTSASVPEPSTYAMFLSGALLLGLVIRRRSMV